MEAQKAVAMSKTSGTTQFAPAGDSYHRFLERYAVPLAEPFARWAGAVPGTTVLDAGCGPGVLTDFLVDLLGESPVCAFDPDPGFVDACRRRLPGVDVRRGSLQAIPFPGPFDLAAAHLVLGAVPDPDAALLALARVARPGGKVAVTVWDAEGMSLLRHLADACASVAPAEAPDAPPTFALGRPGELTDLFEGAGFTSVREIELRVTTEYRDVDELWDGLLADAGPIGRRVAALPALSRMAVRDGLHERLGSPDGAFSLDAVARCCRGVTPR